MAGIYAESQETLKRRGRNGRDTLPVQAVTWKTPHGFQNTDASGKTAGGGGEFAKQVMAWQTPATDFFRSRGGESGSRTPAILSRQQTSRAGKRSHAAGCRTCLRNVAGRSSERTEKKAA
jgi:hypothetical protein